MRRAPAAFASTLLSPSQCRLLRYAFRLLAAPCRRLFHTARAAEVRRFHRDAQRKERLVVSDGFTEP